MTGTARQAREPGFKSRPGLKAHQHLGADDEQAALIEPVLEVRVNLDLWYSVPPTKGGHSHGE